MAATKQPMITVNNIKDSAMTVGILKAAEASGVLVWQYAIDGKTGGTMFDEIWVRSQVKDVFDKHYAGGGKPDDGKKI